MFRILTGIFALLAMALAGCSSLGCGDPHPYMNSPSRPPLKAPAGLSIPTPDPAYAINGITPAPGKSSERDSAGVCLINPPNVLPVANSAKPKSTTVPAPAEGRNTPSSGAQPPAKPADQGQTPAPAAGTSAVMSLLLAAVNGKQ